jgi:Peptidase family M28
MSRSTCILAVLRLRLPLFVLGALAAGIPARAACSPAIGATAFVEPDSIESTIRYLSELEPGVPSSRYAERPETRLIFAPRILELFERHLDSPDTAFLIPFTSARTDTPQVNVMGLIRARRPSQGLFLMTAHYDAIGNREEGWDPATEPAPGADDNASGVACLVEAARLLPAVDLPFDVGLVALGAEEAFRSGAPLEGSRAFVSALEDSGVRVLGVINCDMIAFNPLGKKMDIVSNHSSLWLADLIAEVAASMVPELRVKSILAPLSANSDHASFWAAGEDAVLLIENQFPDRVDSLSDGTVVYPRNPHYHTPSDTAGDLNFDLARDITTAALAAVERFATPLEGQADLAVDSTRIIVPLIRVFVGDQADVEVRVFNWGGEMDNGVGDASVELWRGAPDEGGTFIGEATLELPIGSRFYKSVAIPWRVEESDKGMIELYARVTAAGVQEVSFLNNSAASTITVFSNEIHTLQAVTNPVKIEDAFSEFRFDFQLSVRPRVPQDIEATLYNASGQRFAVHPRTPAKEGRNSLFWRNFDFLGEEAGASGVYFADVRILDQSTGAEASRATGKFVLIR